VTAGRYELHCHLDGSVRLSTIAELAHSEGLVLPRPVAELAVAPADVGSLHGFLPYIDVALDVLQTPAALGRVAGELVEDWAADGVVHGEVRFAPQLHLRQGMSVPEAVVAVARGLLDAGERLGVEVALILCCLRHQPPETSLEVATAAVSHPGLVSGLDLAGDERLPGEPHVEAFAIAHQSGLAVTVHAGEGAGPESVWEAIDVLGARRIGHGVRSVGDRSLLDRLTTDRIALETCPRCNVLTRAVPAMAAHPIDALLRRGLVVTVSTDTRTTADSTLAREFDALGQQFGWGPDEHSVVQAFARESAFPPLDRSRLTSP
jgi:adenosine deaminase